MAELTYQREGNTVIFTHTGVPKAAEGQGVGTALVEAGLAWAKAENARIVPLCPFVIAYLHNHPEAR
ncbi:MAG: N-acetyltransferase [Rhodothermales bacterium]|nr:N-acetyltransferase [Rhodothermales bacterium]